MMYVLLLALFLPWSIMEDSAKLQLEEINNAKIQTMVYYTDQLRISLSAYRGSLLKNGSTIINTEQVAFAKLHSDGFLPPTIAEIKKEAPDCYVDSKGFYIVWKKSPHTNKLARALVKRYTRDTCYSASAQDQQPGKLAFYHIGKAKGKKLVTTVSYQQGSSIQWPLPEVIPDDSLVLTDCDSETASSVP